MAIKLPFQFNKDIKKARDIADKEYQRLLKKRHKNTRLYKIGSLPQFIEFVNKYQTASREKMCPSLVRGLADELNSMKQIAPDVFLHVYNLSNAEVTKVIIK